jgi:hypothetical protein
MAELIPLKESVPRNRVPAIMNALRFGLWCWMRSEWGQSLHLTVRLIYLHSLGSQRMEQRALYLDLGTL